MSPIYNAELPGPLNYYKVPRCLQMLEEFGAGKAPGQQSPSEHPHLCTLPVVCGGLN